MNTQNSNNSQVRKLILEEELLDQSFEQINNDISKALLEMKEDNKETINNNYIDKNIFSNKVEIKKNDLNKNNIIKTNMFNNYNDYRSNNNYYNGNLFPNNHFYGCNNNINNINNNNRALNNINNNYQNMITNNYLNNNYYLNSQIYNINIINCNNNNNDKNNNKNNKLINSEKFVSYRGVPGLFNSDFSKNIINIENILQFKDNRTTLIIRNIPNKYDISLLIKELNNFENKFDVIYLPFDVINNSNLGFGFINFVNPIHILLFFEEFMGKKWNCSNSQKRCFLVYSNYQGKKELVEYIFKKLGIKDLTNNNINETLKKSFYINTMKNIKAPVEIPIKYLRYFVKYYPLCLCNKKDDKVFIFDI